MARRTIGVAERRARLARRHGLAPDACLDDPVDAAAAVVALHATDPASVHLAATARLRDPSIDAVERALYDTRSLLRMLGMRRTMFVVPLDIAAIVEAACAKDVAREQWRRYAQILEQAGMPDAPAWLRDVAESTLRALRARGEATASELTEDEPRLRHQVRLAEGKSYAATVNVTTWVLLLLAADGRIVRGRPRGTWISSQYRWAPVEAWLPGGMEQWTTDRARAELVRRWLAAFGPGTTADVRWWTGWTARETSKAISGAGAVEVDLDDGNAAFVLGGDVEPVDTAIEPWVALLPALDPTVMGWKRRDWFLGEHASSLFDANGNAGPTVWCDGRVVGGWAQRRDGEIAVRMLEDAGSEALAAVNAQAGRLRARMGSVRVTPRFRTPLERELSS